MVKRRGNCCKTMDKVAYLKLMKLPQQWQEWDLLSEVFWREQFKVYCDANADLLKSGAQIFCCLGSEHYRFGLFNYWLAQKPGQTVLNQLEQLAHLDPDPIMASHVLELIGKASGKAK